MAVASDPPSGEDTGLPDQTLCPMDCDPHPA
jgi:hypothetical protein